MLTYYHNTNYNTSITILLSNTEYDIFINYDSFSAQVIIFILLFSTKD